MNKFARNKIVLFDIDGTLLEGASLSSKETSRRMFKKVFGIEAHEEMVESVGNTEQRIILDVINGIFGCNIQKVPDRAYRVWAEETAKDLLKKPAEVLPGVMDLLNALDKEDIPYGLLTGNDEYRAEAKLVSAGIDCYFRDENGRLRGAFGNMAYERCALIDVVKQRMGYPNAIAILVDDSRFVAKMISRFCIPHTMVATGNALFEELKEYVPNVVRSFDNGGWREVIKIVNRY